VVWAILPAAAIPGGFFGQKTRLQDRMNALRPTRTSTDDQTTALHHAALKRVRGAGVFKEKDYRADVNPETVTSPRGFVKGISAVVAGYARVSTDDQNPASQLAWRTHATWPSHRESSQRLQAHNFYKGRSVTTNRTITPPRSPVSFLTWTSSNRPVCQSAVKSLRTTASS
jgi:hypothetical protein